MTAPTHLRQQQSVSPWVNQLVELEHSPLSSSVGRIMDTRGGAEETWTIFWESGPFAGRSHLLINAKLPCETGAGSIRSADADHMGRDAVGNLRAITRAQVAEVAQRGQPTLADALALLGEAVTGLVVTRSGYWLTLGRDAAGWNAFTHDPGASTEPGEAYYVAESVPDSGDPLTDITAALDACADAADADGEATE